MNKVLKWVLIVLGALALIALIAVPIILHGIGPRVEAFREVGPGVNGFREFGRMGRLGGIAPRMGGMMFGMGFLMLFRLLVPLGVLVLAVLGVIFLVRSRKSNHMVTAASQPVVPVEPAVPARLCVKCSKPLEADWKVCPYCGKKQ